MKTESCNELEYLSRNIASMLDELALESHCSIGEFRRMVMTLATPCPAADPDLDRRLKRLLLSLFRVLNEEAELDYEHLLQVIDREVPFHGVTLFQALQGESELQVVYRNGPVVDLLDRFDFGRGAGFSSWVARHQKQILLTNIHSNPEHSKSYVRSFLSVALPHGDRVIGVLNLSHTVRDAFDESDLDLLKYAAWPLGALIERIRGHRDLAGALSPDDLTGLLSPRGTERCVREEFHHARRHRLPLAVAVLAVRGVDAICEAVGEAEADRAMAEVGRLLRRALKAGQGAGRGHSNEFILILPGATTQDAQRLLVSCSQEVSRVPIDRGPSLHACAGVAVLRPDDVTPSGLIERAAEAARISRSRARVVAV